MKKTDENANKFQAKLEKFKERSSQMHDESLYLHAANSYRVLRQRNRNNSGSKNFRSFYNDDSMRYKSSKPAVSKNSSYLDKIKQKYKYNSEESFTSGYSTVDENRV